MFVVHAAGSSLFLYFNTKQTASHLLINSDMSDTKTRKSKTFFRHQLSCIQVFPLQQAVDALKQKVELDVSAADPSQMFQILQHTADCQLRGTFNNNKFYMLNTDSDGYCFRALFILRSPLKWISLTELLQPEECGSTLVTRSGSHVKVWQAQWDKLARCSETLNEPCKTTTT